MTTENGVSRQKGRHGVVESIAWMVFAVAAFAVTFSFDGPLPTYEFGAAMWPRLVAVGIFVAAGILLWTRLSDATEPGDLPADERDTDTPPETEPKVTIKTVAIFLVPIVYVAAIHKLGFLLATPFFLFGYMYFLGVRKWRTLFGVTIGFYATVVLIFVKVIFTPLPQGAGIFHTLNGHLLGFLQ